MSVNDLNLRNLYVSSNKKLMSQSSLESGDSALQDAHQKEEQQLTMWLNSQLDPNLPNEIYEQKLHLHEALLDECRAVKGRLEEEINWTRFLPASMIRQNWTRRLNGSIESYRECWLKLALQAQKNLFDVTPNLQATVTNISTSKQLLRLIVPANCTSKWNQTVAVRFLTLVYFLDRAKHKAQMWDHQPSLFVPNCANREFRSKEISSSEQILNQFGLTCLSAGMGGQFKSELRAASYQLEHVECEAEITVCFAVNQLSTDLADGVRLAKLVEILFSHENANLVKSLKFPAKRSADRVANMIHLFGSFLWPKLTQYDPERWNHVQMRKVASEVANCYRDSTVRLFQSLSEVQLKMALEHRYKSYLPQIVALQRRVKEWLKSRKQRAEYLRLRQTAIWVQQRYRAKLAARTARAEFLQMKAAAVCIQKRFRLRKNLKVVRQYVNEFVERRRQAAITIQRHWRGATTRWRARVQYEFDMMFMVTKIELNAAIPGMRPTIATKADQLLKRLEVSARQGDIKPILQNSGAVTKLLGDLQALNDYAYCSLEIRARILRDHCTWLLVHFAKLLQCLNRSEHHKSIAINVLAVVNCLTMDIRMKSILVAEFVPSTWFALTKSLIQMMHDYINYPLLMQQAITTLHRLAEREKRATGNGSGDIEQLLTCDRLWQRLVERIKDKYRIEQTKDNKHLGECHNDPSNKCSCNSVKSEFRRLIAMMEGVGEQSNNAFASGTTAH